MSDLLTQLLMLTPYFFGGVAKLSSLLTDEAWEVRTRQKRQLAGAGARLARPARAAAFATWREEWHAAEREVEAAAHAALLKEQARPRPHAAAAARARALVQVAHDGVGDLLHLLLLLVVVLLVGLGVLVEPVERRGKVGRADLVYKKIPNLYLLNNTSPGIRHVFDTWNHEKSIEKLPRAPEARLNNNPEPSAPRRERLALRRLRQVPRRWLRHLLTHVPQRRRDRAVVAPVRPQRAEVDAPRPRVDAPQADARLEIYLRRHPRVVRAADDLQTVDVVVEARAGRPDDR